MATEIEVNMRVPTLTVRAANEPDRRIDNSAVRFMKRIQVPALPKAGELLSLSTDSGRTTFECTVMRSDWNEEKGLFVVACTYAKRSLPVEIYSALVNDGEWTMKPLL
jgi:galactokinase